MKFVGEGYIAVSMEQAAIFAALLDILPKSANLRSALGSGNNFRADLYRFGNLP
jgi:hypothetical protein